MGVTIATMRAAVNTSTGNQNFTTADLGGLTPKAVIAILTKAITDGTAADHFNWCIGAATGAANEWCNVGVSEHGVATTNTFKRQPDDRLCLLLDETTQSTIIASGEFNAFIADGVTINWTTAPTAAYLLTLIFFAGTDVQAHANSVGVGNTVDLETNITAPGFQPQLVFGSVGIAPAGAGSLNSSFGWAWDNSGTTVQRAISQLHRDGRADGDPRSFVRNDCTCLALQVASGFVDWQADIDNFDADGFSVFTRIAGGNLDNLQYLALDFGASFSVWLGDAASPTATGNQSFTTPSFTPQWMFYGLATAEAYNTRYIDSLAGSMGAGTFDADDEFSNTASEEDAAATMNNQSLSDDTAINLPDDDGTALLTASFVSFDANGWTLNYSAVDATAKVFWAVAVEEEAVGVSNPPGWNYRKTRQDVLLRM